jgi:ethanolamine ammonia-lyase small subunit
VGALVDGVSESNLHGAAVRVAPFSLSETSLQSATTDLRLHTTARVSLARTGVSLTTRDTLAFALDHAQARDAVHATLSLPTLLAELAARKLPAIVVKSAAPDRATYLRRPDLGRTLSAASKAALDATTAQGNLTIILADGLSALATDCHAIPLLDALLPLIESDFTLTPIVIAEQARVALGDEIAVALRSNLTLMLIGERPGLSAADSLGAYITWAARIGTTNAERNCISNIRAEGLAPPAAAERIAFYLREALRLKLTGIALKDQQLDDPSRRALLA